MFVAKHGQLIAVHCVNCGGGTGTDWPTVVALVLAAVAAAAAAWSLWIQSREHKRLTTELEKRADFEIKIAPPGGAVDSGPDGATMITSAQQINLLFGIGVKNIGDRAANHVTINFLAPDRYSSLQWTGPSGEPMYDKPTAAYTIEQLSETQGDAPTRFLRHGFERIALRTPREVNALVTADVPMNGTVDLTVRVRVQSDDLPDDVPERVKDFVVHIRRE